jgi:uncharacterized repeat protein (TIGR01451 family)
MRSRFLDRLLATTIGVVVAFTVTMGLGAVPGLAAEGPVWEVSSESFPTNFAPGGTGAYVLHVKNVGTGTSDGSTITVVDRLPPGMTATSADGEFLESVPTGGEYWQCPVTSGTTVVTCTNNQANLPTIAPGQERREGTAPYIVINVATEAGHPAGPADNTVSVSGGGASEAKNTTQTVISASPAPFGLGSFEQLLLNRDGTPDTKAGSHPYESIANFIVNSLGQVGEPRFPSKEIKDLEISLPPGFVGNPDATPRCSRVLFDRGREEGTYEPACPADTRVGTEFLIFGAGGVANFPSIMAVYNVEPPSDVAAQFGFAFQNRVGFIDFGVRTGEGYEVKAVLHNLVQVHVLRSSLVLWGQPTDSSHDTEREGSVAFSPVPLLTMPTSCGTPLGDLVSMDSWEEPAAEPSSVSFSPFSYPFTASYPVTDNKDNRLAMQGCGKLQFDPALEVTPETSATNTPTGLDVKLSVPQNPNPEGLATAHLKDAVVTLPAGVTVSPSAANGLAACTPTEIGLTNGNEPTCPAASKIGTVTGHTPLLDQPLTGSVYVAQPGENPFGSLLAIYVTAEADGALIKLAGHVQANPATGQLTATFDENPQLPFSDLTVNFYGGPRAALVTPSACGTYTTNAQLTGYNGAVVLPAIQPFRIASGCEAPGFSPSFVAGTTNNVAGGFAPFSTTITRPDGNQPLGAVSVKTPPGLLGMLSQVTLCTEAQAAQAACPAASLIGHVTAVAGPGPYPVTVGGGQVFLTGPYKGAPFGLLIVVPAVAGPFNLGNVAVRATINADPHTAQITITSDLLPTILQGIPLDVRAINVVIDRSQFIFNPTSCDPLSSSATIASSEGASILLSSRFQAADCASLAFKPKFTVSTQAQTSHAKGASLDVKVALASGQANIVRVAVKLPVQLPSRLTTLRQACLAATFEANPANCPAGSVVGTATGITPVLPVPVSGPAYLVSHGGEAFPDLVVVLQGDGVRLDLVGNTSITHGITSSTFASVPDAPVSSFELKLPEGPHSVLGPNLPAKANGSLCSSKLAMPTTITAQNGAQFVQSTKIAVTGCPKAHRAKKARKAKR